MDFKFLILFATLIVATSAKPGLVSGLLSGVGNLVGGAVTAVESAATGVASTAGTAVASVANATKAVTTPAKNATTTPSLGSSLAALTGTLGSTLGGVGNLVSGVVGAATGSSGCTPSSLLSSLIGPASLDKLVQQVALLTLRLFQFLQAQQPPAPPVDTSSSVNGTTTAVSSPLGGLLDTLESIWWIPMALFALVKLLGA